MLSPLIHGVVLVSSIAAAVVAGFGVILLRPAGDRSKSRRPMLGALAVLVFCVATAYWTAGYSIDVIVVREDMSFERGKMRAMEADLPTSDRSGPSAFSDPVWIVNRSFRELRVVKVVYGRKFGYSDSVPTVIPADRRASG